MKSPTRFLLLPLALLAAAACQASGPTPPVAQNHIHTSPSASPAEAASPSPSAAAPSPGSATSAPSNAGTPDRCHTAGLAVTPAGRTGAAGTIVDTYRLANQTTAPCVVFGFAGMQMLDAAGAPIPTRMVRLGGMFSQQAGPSRFTLQPGAAASFQAAWSDVPHGSEGPCPQSSRLEVTPPDEFDHVILAVTIAPCGGGEIDVTPLRASGAGPA
jgi:hypothetical protein